MFKMNSWELEESEVTNPLAQFGGGGIKNPMAHSHTLGMILNYLTVPDLKQCRLVSKFWREVATKPLQKKSVGDLHFGDPSGGNPRVKGMREMKKLVECVDTGKCFPCARYFVSTDIIRNSNREKDEAVFVDFFKSISPFVLELLILCDGEKGALQLEDGAPSYFNDLKFPRLKRFCLIIRTLKGRSRGHRDLAWKHRSVLELTTIAMKTSNSLKCVWLDTSPYCAPEAIPLLLNSLVEANNRKITYLEIPAPTEDSIWENMLRLRCYLNCFKVNFVTEEKKFGGLTPFLEAHGFTLKTLNITSDSTVPADCVPNLPRLQKLIIQAKETCGNEAQADFIFPMIPMTHKFSNLKSVSFTTHASWNPSPWKEFIEFGDEVVVKTITMLTLPSSLDDPEVVLKAAKVFPNIEHLGVPAKTAMMNVVVEAFPQLEMLTLDTTFAPSKGIDHVLTGMTPEVCEDALIKMKNWSTKFDDTIFAPGIASAPLHCLNKLTILRLYTSCRERKLEFTKVSICLVFMKMRSLRFIDLGYRLPKFRPEVDIPKRVFNELTKRCEINWDFLG